MAIQELHLKITGMTCGHCENFVKSVISELDGVNAVTVDHKTGTGTVTLDDTKVDAQKVIGHLNETVAYHAERV